MQIGYFVAGLGNLSMCSEISQASLLIRVHSCALLVAPDIVLIVGHVYTQHNFDSGNRSP